MFKRVATILNRLVACLFTEPSSETVIKPSNTASNLLVQSGQRCRDALTQLQQSQSANQKSKDKPLAVQSDTQAKSRKRTPKTVMVIKQYGQDGLQPATPVEKSRQDLSNKPSVAPSTKAEQSSSKGRTTTKRKATPAGKTSATPVRKTRQAVAQAQTQKTKAAVSTTQAKKRTPSKTPAQTRTARQSKARGS